MLELSILIIWDLGTSSGISAWTPNQRALVLSQPMPAVQLSGVDKLTHLPTYQNRWSKAAHAQLKNYCISLNLSSRKSLRKISWKIMSPIFSSFPTVLLFYFQENEQFFLISAQLQRQRATLCYIPATKYDFCLSLDARLILQNDSIMHGNEIPDLFLMVNSLLWYYELWMLPKLQNLYQLWNSSAEVTISSLGNTMSRRMKKSGLHSFVFSSGTESSTRMMH